MMKRLKWLIYIGLGFHLWASTGAMEINHEATETEPAHIEQAMQLLTQGQKSCKKLGPKCRRVFCLQPDYDEEVFCDARGYEGGWYLQTKGLCQSIYQWLKGCKKKGKPCCKESKNGVYPIIWFWCLTGSLMVHGIINVEESHKHKIKKLLPSQLSFCKNLFWDHLNLPHPTDMEAQIRPDTYGLGVNLSGLGQAPHLVNVYGLAFAVEGFASTIQSRVQHYELLVGGSSMNNSRVTAYLPKISFYQYRREKICYTTDDLLTKKVLNWRHNEKKRVCKYFVESKQVSIEGLKVTSENLTDGWYIKSGLYGAVLSAEWGNRELGEPSIVEPPSYREFIVLTDRVSEVGEEAFLDRLYRGIAHIKGVASVHVFITALMPFVRTGHVVRYMKPYLYLRSSIGIISKIYFIPLLFVVAYVLRMIPLQHDQRVVDQKGDSFFWHLFLKIRPHICYLEVAQEAHLVYLLDQMAETQERSKLTLQRALSLVDATPQVWCNSSNVTSSLCVDIFESLEDDIVYYRNLLNGSKFLPSGFSYLPNKRVCDPLLGLEEGDLPCGTVFDTSYALPALEEFRQAYAISYENMPTRILLYPLTPILISFWLISFIGMIAPMAEYGGALLATSTPSTILQKHIEASLRRAKILPFLLTSGLLLVVLSI